jgi:hypothetical protein
MTISISQKTDIETILTENLNKWDKLFETYNLFPSDGSYDVNGKIGWDILSHIVEMNKKYRNFIVNLPENFTIRLEVGNYVYDVIRKKVEEYSD